MGISWWRMAFIFGPAIARGDISSFSLYTPFIFGERAREPVRSRAALGGAPCARGEAGEPSLGSETAGVPRRRGYRVQPRGGAAVRPRGVRGAGRLARGLQRGAPDRCVPTVRPAFSRDRPPFSGYPFARCRRARAPPRCRALAVADRQKVEG